MWKLNPALKKYRAHLIRAPGYYGRSCVILVFVLIEFHCKITESFFLLALLTRLKTFTLMTQPYKDLWSVSDWLPLTRENSFPSNRHVISVNFFCMESQTFLNWVQAKNWLVYFPLSPIEGREISEPKETEPRPAPGDSGRHSGLPERFEHCC